MFNSTNGWDATIDLPLGTPADRAATAAHLAELRLTAETLREAGRPVERQVVQQLHELEAVACSGDVARIQVLLQRAHPAKTRGSAERITVPFQASDAILDASLAELAELSYHALTGNADAFSARREPGFHPDEFSDNAWLYARDVFTLWGHCTVGQNGRLTIRYE